MQAKFTDIKTRANTFHAVIKKSTTIEKAALKVAEAGTSTQNAPQKQEQEKGIEDNGLEVVPLKRSPSSEGKLDGYVEVLRRTLLKSKTRPC